MAAMTICHSTSASRSACATSTGKIAGVPAGAHEDGAADVGVGVALERVRDGTHRQGHVRARVPVGDRIHVEIVDARAARLERGQRRAYER